MPFDQIYWNNYGAIADIAELGHFVKSSAHDVRFGQTKTEDSHSVFSFAGERRDRIMEFYNLYYYDGRNPYNERNREEIYKVFYDPSFDGYDQNDPSRSRYAMGSEQPYVFGWPDMESYENQVATNTFYGNTVNNMTVDDIENVYTQKRNYSRKINPDDGSVLNEGTSSHSTLSDDLFQAQNRESCHWLSNTAHAHTVENPFIGIHKDNPITVTADKNFLGYALVLKRKRYNYWERNLRLVHPNGYSAIDPRPFKQHKTDYRRVFLGSWNQYHEQVGDASWNQTNWYHVKRAGYTWTIGVNWDKYRRTKDNANFRIKVPDSDGYYPYEDEWTPTFNTNVDCFTGGGGDGNGYFDVEAYVDGEGNQIYYSSDEAIEYNEGYNYPSNMSKCTEFKMIWVEYPSDCPGSFIDYDSDGSTVLFDDNLCSEFALFDESAGDYHDKIWEDLDTLSNDSSLESDIDYSIYSNSIYGGPNIMFMYYPDQGGCPWNIVQLYTKYWWQHRGGYCMKKKSLDDAGVESTKPVAYGYQQSTWEFIYTTARRQNQGLGCYLKTVRSCNSNENDPTGLNWWGYTDAKMNFCTNLIADSEFYDWMDGCYWTVDHWMFSSNRSSAPSNFNTIKDSGNKILTDKWFFRQPGTAGSSYDGLFENSTNPVYLKIGRPLDANNTNGFSNINGTFPFGAVGEQYIESNSSNAVGERFWDVDNYDMVQRSGAAWLQYNMFFTRMPKIGHAAPQPLSTTTQNNNHLGNFSVVDIHEARHIESYVQPYIYQQDFTDGYPRAHPYSIYWTSFFQVTDNDDLPMFPEDYFHEGETLAKHKWVSDHAWWEGDSFFGDYLGLLGDTHRAYKNSEGKYEIERVWWKDSIDVKDAAIHPSYSKRQLTDTGSIYLKNMTIKKNGNVLHAWKDTIGEWIEQPSSEIYTDRSSKIVATNTSSNRKVITFSNMYSNNNNRCKRYFDTSFQIKFGNSTTWHEISAVNNGNIVLTTSPNSLSNSSFTLRIPRGSPNEDYTWGNYKLSNFDGDNYTLNRAWQLGNQNDVTWFELFISTPAETEKSLYEIFNTSWWGDQSSGGITGKPDRHPFFSNELSESLHIRNGFTSLAYWQDSYWNNRAGQFGHVSSKVKGNVNWDVASWVSYWECAHTVYDGPWKSTNNGEPVNYNLDFGEPGDSEYWKGPRGDDVYPYQQDFNKPNYNPVGGWIPPTPMGKGDYRHIRPPAVNMANYATVQASSAGWFSNLDNFTMDPGIAAPVKDTQGNSVNFRINSFIFGGMDKASGAIWPGYGYDQSVRYLIGDLDTNIENKADWASMMVDAFGIPDTSGNVPLMPYLDRPWMAFSSFKTFPAITAYYQIGQRTNYDTDIASFNMTSLENAGNKGSTLGNFWKDNSAGKALRRSAVEPAEKSRLEKSLLNEWVLASYGYDNDIMGWGNKTAGTEPHFITIFESNEFIKKGTTFSVSFQQAATAFNRELERTAGGYSEIDETLGMGRTTIDIDSYELYLCAIP
jgi:hypothetical protein